MSRDGKGSSSLEYYLHEWGQEKEAWRRETEKARRTLLSRERKDWVCWQHALLDFNDDDITFVVKAHKRMEQICIHHYALNITKTLDFSQIIDQAKQKSCFIRGDFDELHRFRIIRNKLVHAEDYNEISQEQRKKLNTACMEIFGRLEQECNCKELYEGEKHFSYRKLYRTITLPDDRMYGYTHGTELFLDAITPRTKRIRATKRRERFHTQVVNECNEGFWQSYSYQQFDKKTSLRDFIMADSNLVDAWNEHIAAQSSTRTLALVTNIIVQLKQLDIYIILEDFKKLAVTIGFGFVKLVEILLALSYLSAILCWIVALVFAQLPNRP